ncbi:hypothetical protein, partial [Vibrio jasicida]|uniref:hypothetical protein n=1 Tax=Vibrio jasicida TaxID=766224 RepID=UPI001D10C975
LAEQRIPNPRVGSSNLSTPAIFKALAEMLEPFSFLSLLTSDIRITWRPLVRSPLGCISHRISGVPAQSTSFYVQSFSQRL